MNDYPPQLPILRRQCCCGAGVIRPRAPQMNASSVASTCVCLKSNGFWSKRTLCSLLRTDSRRATQRRRHVQTFLTLFRFVMILKGWYFFFLLIRAVNPAKDKVTSNGNREAMGGILAKIRPDGVTRGAVSAANQRPAGGLACRFQMRRLQTGRFTPGLGAGRQHKHPTHHPSYLHLSSAFWPQCLVGPFISGTKTVTRGREGRLQRTARTRAAF
jgi:hypothetical protein